ncbi:hypothetical protein [Sorangium sp. So ce341]|uniref:hypothetical protein n=1 Tax=Sorangium sp. So ce341 TaxID=3133302 RepID=UPI003F622872
MFDDVFQVLLPHGIPDDTGARHREAWVRPLSGRDEVSLGRGARRTLEDMAAAHVTRIGGYTEVDVDLVADLTRGDMMCLCLSLRAQLLGDEVVLVVACPSPSCRQLSHLDVAISEVAPPRAEAAPATFRVETPAGPATLREPTGRDDRAAREAGGGSRGAAILLSRVLVDLAGNGPLSAEQVAALPPGVRNAIALGLAEGTSAPDLTFVTRCPSCAARFSVRLDPVRLLEREAAIGEDRLISEVATLAFFYHWAEADVLVQPRTRRWRYLEALGQQLRGEPLATGWR